jgi:predicted ribosome quality control (RQC) complex YloA/Tae2 family protein
MTTSTKVMSVRMPLPEYMDLLQKASENTMTVSDYALQLIYLNKSKPVVSLRNEDTVKELNASRTELQATVKRLNDAIRANQQYVKVEAQDKAKITELEKKNQVLQDANNKLERKLLDAEVAVQNFKSYAEGYLFDKDGKPYKYNR